LFAIRGGSARGTTWGGRGGGRRGALPRGFLSLAAATPAEDSQKKEEENPSKHYAYSEISGLLFIFFISIVYINNPENKINNLNSSSSSFVASYQPQQCSISQVPQ
jgi:hypothetical protein